MYMNSARKGTEFYLKQSLVCGNKMFNIAKPLVMGILNITPDSFYAGSRFAMRESWMAAARQMLAEGAAILDVGAVSSRPGADTVSEDEELRRLIPVVEELVRTFPCAVFSIDTYHASVAARAVESGAHIINDISAGELDPAMFETISGLGVPYIMMHMKGTPNHMQSNPVYTDVVNDIKTYFERRLEKLCHYGAADVLLDPGFGFGKTIFHNYEILRRLNEFTSIGLPIVAGISRKSMIYKVLDSTPEEALTGTTVLHTLALLNGADILRVHDVREAVETIKLIEVYKNKPV